MASLPKPVPALQHVSVAGFRGYVVKVRISKWHEPFVLYIIDTGMRFHVANNRLGANRIYAHKTLTNCIEHAMKKAESYVRTEWAAFNRKKTLNG